MHPGSILVYKGCQLRICHCRKGCSKLAALVRDLAVASHIFSLEDVATLQEHLAGWQQVHFWKLSRY